MRKMEILDWLIKAEGLQINQLSYQRRYSYA